MSKSSYICNMNRDLTFSPDTVGTNPFGAVMYLMAKPAGAACNLACEYCYYLEKAQPGEKQIMDLDTLEEFTRQYIEAQTLEEVMFTWHGGEAMLRPIDFYRKALEFQQKYGKGRRILNSLQTNGTLITEEWCKFFKENNWLVGVSIDGPEEFHDEYRRARGGKPTFQSVMRGIRMLQRYGVEWNGMAVVNDYNADYPEEFYDFFKEIGCKYIQFTPIVERKTADGRLATIGDTGEVTAHTVSAEQWGEFLCRLFDRWVNEDVGKVFVQLFDSTLARWVGQQPGVCTMSTVCGHAGVMEHNGDVYSCDHFVFPKFKLGNIHHTSIMQMMTDPRQIAFGVAKRGSLPSQCKECRYTMICNGECPKNRIINTADGELGLNYLCSGYKRFFNHVAPYMDYMALELKNQRPPASVMQMVDKLKRI